MSKLQDIVVKEMKVKNKLIAKKKSMKSNIL